MLLPSVQNNVGTPIIVNPAFGFFYIDTVAPTASVTTSAPNINATGASGNTTTVEVTYADTGGPGIDPSTFGDGNISVNHGATVTGFTPVGDVVTYTITAPGSNWGTSTQGTYTDRSWWPRATCGTDSRQRRRRRRSASLSSFLVDTVPPTASVTSAPNVTFAQASGHTTTVQVTYSDATSGVNTATFGTGNITVSNGATVTGFSASGDVVTYTITAPSSTWNTSPQGAYTISLVAGTVQDNLGNPNAAVASLGSFVVNTAPPTASVSGIAYFDYNSNGVFDSGEPGLANVMVYIDLSHSGTYEPSDPSVLTDSNGSYTFSSLPPGTYTIAVQPTPGHVGTSAPLTVTLNGANMTGKNLGVLNFSPVDPVLVTPQPRPANLRQRGLRLRVLVVPDDPGPDSDHCRGGDLG